MIEQRLQDSTAGKVLPKLPISSIFISTRPPVLKTVFQRRLSMELLSLPQPPERNYRFPACTMGR
jgi:hypothetical protein